MNALLGSKQGQLQHWKMLQLWKIRAWWFFHNVKNIKLISQEACKYFQLKKTKEFKKLWAWLNETPNVKLNLVMLSFASNVVVPTHLITSIVPYGTIVTPSPNNINLKNIDAQVEETSVDML